jgi:hypothetical protein
MLWTDIETKMLGARRLALGALGTASILGGCQQRLRDCRSAQDSGKQMDESKAVLVEFVGWIAEGAVS